jgi:hypothetical protein
VITCLLLVLGKLFLPHFCHDELVAIQMLAEREASLCEYWAHWRKLWSTRR